MKRKQCLQSSVQFPDDLALKIASCLEVSDVCSLGSCSWFWRDICGSDYVWKSLCKERWPALVRDEESSVSKRENHDVDQQKGTKFKGWKAFYIKKHSEMVEKVAVLGQHLSCESFNYDDYLKMIEDMNSMQLGFRDVQILFLKPGINVLLNLLGLHYCIKHLGLTVDSVNEAIRSCKIQDRQVCVQWCRHGGWLYRFRLPDEFHSRCISLGELTTSDGQEVLEVLNRGITPLVLRIQISAEMPKSTHHCCEHCTRISEEIQI